MEIKAPTDHMIQFTVDSSSLPNRRDWRRVRSELRFAIAILTSTGCPIDQASAGLSIESGFDHPRTLKRSRFTSPGRSRFHYQADYPLKDDDHSDPATATYLRKESPVRRVSECLRPTRLRLSSFGIGLLLVFGPTICRLAGEMMSPDGNEPAELVVGTQVVPIDSRVIIRRATVQVLAMVGPDVSQLNLPSASPFDLVRPQARKLDLPAAEDFLFRIEHMREKRVEIISQDHRTRGWLNRDQVVRLVDGEAHFSRAIAKNASDSGAFLLRARVRIVRQKWESAIADLDAAIRLDPKNAMAHRALGPGSVDGRP